MRMSLPGNGSGGSGSFLEQRVARRKRLLQMVMRRFGSIDEFARTRRGGARP